MFDQFQASIKLSSELTILVEKVQQYGVTVQEAKIEDNFSSSYNNYYKVIKIDLASSSYMINALLHEFGHHLQTLDSNYSKTWDKYYQEEDAWNRGEAYYQLIFDKPVPSSYHIQKAESLTTYKDWQGYSNQYFHWHRNDIGEEPSKREGIFPNCCDISLCPQTKIAQILAKTQVSIKVINKWVILAGLTACLLIGVTTFNSSQFKQSVQEQCTDYNCIF